MCFYVYECFAYMYVIVLCVCSALQDQKKASDTLELELQEVVGFRNWTLIHC